MQTIPFGVQRRRRLGNIFDDLNTFVTKTVTPLVASGTALYNSGQQVSTQVTQAVQQPQQQQAQAPAQVQQKSAGLSTGEMIGIGIGVASIIATVVVASSNSSKKEK